MATKEMTHLGTYVVPKVNLLPPEIDEKKAQQRAYVAMGAVVVAAVGAVGVLYAAQASRIGKAQDELAAAKSRQATLSAEQQKLVYVDQVFATVDANEALLRRAVEKRIPWSRNLHDLALTMPDSVWLRTMTIAQKVDEVSGGGEEPVLAEDGLGTVTFEGRAFTHDQVAAWLAAMAKVKAYDNAFISKSELKVPSEEEAAAGAKRYVKWVGQITISAKAVDSKSVTK
jgi:Tfp pilus assembly protein PilN